MKINIKDRLKTLLKTHHSVLGSVIAILLVLNIGLGGYFALRYKDYQKTGEVLGASFTIPKFDPSYVMSDYTFANQNIFSTQQSIQNYLDKVNSPLKNYSEKGKLASAWIFSASNGSSSAREGITPRINPAVLLAYLEKENSLLSFSNYNTALDPDGRIRNAMGYGCPDTAGCNSIYAGFANQINFGAFQLQYNFNLATNNQPDTYKLNNTIKTLDDYDVNLTNSATASSYRYTPHVYWGNYNLWKILTANGWGISPQTYKMEDIDAYNLQYKTKPVSAMIYTNLSDIDKLLNTNYTFGDTGENISKLQLFLKQKGYFLNDITGYFGGITKQALQNYIRDQKNTQKLIESTAQNTAQIPAQPSAFSCQELYVQNYSIGDTNDKVSQLQQCLKDKKYFDYAVTGYFGYITKASLDKWKGINSVDSSSSSNSNLKTTSIPAKTNAQFNIPKDVLVIPIQNATQNTNPNQVVGTNTIQNNKTNKLTENFSCDSYKKMIWSIGESGERVRILQICMQSEGKFNYSGGATGYFGENTKKSLISWRGYF